MLLTGEKSTVPLLKTRSLFWSKLAVRAAFAANVIFAEKFSPSSAATSESSTSVKMYQTFLPSFMCPRYRGIVIVPVVVSTGPVFNSWTGPTKLRLTEDGGGPKYERFTVAPTE